MEGSGKRSPQSPLKLNLSRGASNSASDDEGKESLRTSYGEVCKKLEEELKEGTDSAIPSRVSSMPVMPSDPLERKHPSLARGFSVSGWEPAGKTNPSQPFSKVASVSMEPLSNSKEAPVPVSVLMRSKTEVMARATEKRLQRMKSRKLREIRAQELAEVIQKFSDAATIGQDYGVRVGDLSNAVSFAEREAFDSSGFGVESDSEQHSKEKEHVPHDLKIAILIVGTRGDVQPFIAIGRRLKDFGHRVRLASHSNYREFITSAGLEFYPLGGDPKVLAEYMVKNKGFLPGRPSEVVTQRKQLRAIVNSLWPACTEADKESGKEFIADAIIANPPCIAHAHVAERLMVPLHVFFTMPWSPTTAYPHPLARMVHFTGFDNWLSYAIVDNVMWLGMRDIVNDFRKKKLKLPPVSLVSGPNLATDRIPFGYIWSPSLAPKPKDWGKLIDVCGFCFLEGGDHYKPPNNLQEWLDDGPPPIFIGFGSLNLATRRIPSSVCTTIGSCFSASAPVEKPEKMTEIIVASLAETKQRGIIQRGWGGLGNLKTPVPDVITIGDCPHDWLFPRCAAVVHHGGAGTTAAGLRAGKPTTVVPFFGDQPFWGARVHHEKVGPEPILHFTQPNLVAAINCMLADETKEAARVLAEKMATENGVENAVNAFHKQLPPGIHTGKRSKHNTDWIKPNRCSWFCGRNSVVTVAE